MKKIFCFEIIICMLLSQIVLGTEEFDSLSTETNEGAEAQELETAQEESELFQGEEEATYLNSYEDIYNAFQPMSSDAMYQEAYEEMMLETIENYKSSSRDEVVRAKVTKAGEEEVYFPTDGYDVYKIRYQKVTVEILEGEHKGETFETDYVLSADSYENLEITPIEEGKIINVVYMDVDGEGKVYATTLDASVEKFPAIVVLAIITLVCMALFLGKYGLRIVPQMILILDLVLFVFVPEVLNSANILWLTIISLVAYIIVETAVKLGITSKSIAAIVTTAAVSVVMALLVLWFNTLASIEGITMEIANIVEAYPLGNIDFSMLTFCIFLFMLVPVISNISCQAIKVFDENEEKTAREKIRKYTSGMLPIVVVILLAVTIQRFLYLRMIKYTRAELLNSEMLLTEFLRMMFIIIGACLTPLVAEQAKKLF